MDRLIGNILHQQYRVESLLSSQTGRRTFLASDLHTHSPVIIKILLFNPDFTWDDLKLFEREAETLKALDHSAIPKYLDFFEVEVELGKGFALVQSYIEARSLQDWLESGRNFSETDLKTIAIDLLEILDYLHARHPPVIHRDLKPSNILLGDRSGNSPGQVYLVDFGSVQTIATTGTMTIVGTYGYMPPEQFGGRTVPVSDLYSLGATLIYLLTGTHPAELLSHNGRIEFESEFASDRFQSWLTHLMQPDIKQRPQSARAAVEALQNDRLLATRSSVPTKPHGSRVILTNTGSQFKISIPALSTKQKLDRLSSLLVIVIFGIAIPTCVLLLSVAWFPHLSLLLVIWITACSIQFWIDLWSKLLRLWRDLWSHLWRDEMQKAFISMELAMELTIDDSTVRLVIDWLGMKKHYSCSIQDVTGISDFRYPDRRPELKFWMGNQCHSLKKFDLTGLEVDWLAFELSDRLGIPTQLISVINDDNPTVVGTTHSKSVSPNPTAATNPPA